MIGIRTSLLSTLVLLFFCSRGIAATLEPARLENADAVAALVRFPDTAKDGEMIIIRIGTTVSARGAVAPGIYFDAAQTSIFAPYEDEVANAIQHLRVAPARVNGRTTPVWLNFSVIFDSMQSVRQVRIVPNLQYDVARYGDHYVDPQRIDSEKLPAKCFRKSPLWTLTKTDADGAPLSTSVISGTVTKSCEGALRRLLQRSTYIPAQSNGQHVAGTYVEAWYITS